LEELVPPIPDAIRWYCLKALEEVEGTGDRSKEPGVRNQRSEVKGEQAGSKAGFDVRS
jgi:hypothetical protein